MKKIINPFLAGIIILLFIGSCSQTSIDSDLEYVRTTTLLEYVDMDGNNILSENSHITIFYKIGNRYEEVRNMHLDNPYGFILTQKKQVLYDDNDEYIVKLTPSHFFEENLATTVVQVDDFIGDTLIHERFILDEQPAVKIWHNSKLAWEPEVGKVRLLTIKK